MELTPWLVILVLFFGFFLLLAVLSPQLLPKFFDSFLPDRQGILSSSEFPLASQLEDCQDLEEINSILTEKQISYQILTIQPGQHQVLTNQYNSELNYCKVLGGGLVKVKVENDKEWLMTNSLLQNFKLYSLINTTDRPVEVLLATSNRQFSNPINRALSKLVSYTRKVRRFEVTNYG